jgi:cysteinyl-tRNA synthetase
VCGPTVYDYAHLGHARCYIVYDVLVRHLRASGMRVTYARNVTDIDDKIINRAAERGERPDELAARFTEAYREDMARLGNVAPNIEPKVSEHLPQIIALVQRLIDSGNAYAVDGDVYFAVESFEGYGKLSHRDLEAHEAGASGRLDADQTARKRHPADFALWKSAAQSEVGWDSPFGWGRPGWHIECSAMSMEHLGETLDLHGGGLDLVFPHHENELAQSEAATCKPFSRCWMHNGFVEVNKEKMGKSLGNFFTARELFRTSSPRPCASSPWACTTARRWASSSKRWTERRASRGSRKPRSASSTSTRPCCACASCRLRASCPTAGCRTPSRTSRPRSTGRSTTT